MICTKVFRFSEGRVCIDGNIRTEYLCVVCVQLAMDDCQEL